LETALIGTIQLKKKIIILGKMFC